MTTGFVRTMIVTLFALSVAYPQQISRSGRVFRRLDGNVDGKVTRDEAPGAPWFGRLDRDGDGVVTLEEVRRRGSRSAVGSPSPLP